jgi:hypothetical protein
MLPPSYWLLLAFLLTSLNRSDAAKPPKQHANPDDFIYVQNGAFQKACSPHYLVSMNYWSVM